uniref:Uncharacterized protein n=1 Tax=Steinernema glaseri TaxID=37863 RepID=A0A1I7ZR28_9BILA
MIHSIVARHPVLPTHSFLVWPNYRHFCHAPFSTKTQYEPIRLPAFAYRRIILTTHTVSPRSGRGTSDGLLR